MFRKPLPCLDVICLCPFISAAQKENDGVAIFLVTDPVARTIVEAQFTDAASYRLYVTRVSKGQSIQA